MKSIFNVEYVPEIDIKLSELTIYAQEMIGEMSISGVQPKLSVKLNKKTKKLEVVSHGGEYILKPQFDRFPNLPQNEELCMSIAFDVGIDVPPHVLIKLKDGSWAYVVKRFDRKKSKKIHQEDFFQILNKGDKYKGSLEEIGKKIKQISKVPGLDVQLFYERNIYFFLIGNGDAHMKNYSILYDENADARLSPAYDIVSSKLVLPREEDLSLTMNGKKNKIRKNDFLKFAEYLDIPEKIATYFFQDKKNLFFKKIEESLLNDEEKERLVKIVDERFERLI